VSALAERDPNSDLFDEARRLEEGVLHYEHSHRYARAFWSRVNNVLGLTAALGGAAATAANIPSDRPRGAALGLSIVTAAAAAALAFFRPAERAANHASAAAEFNVLRGDLRRFHSIRTDASRDAVERRLTELVNRRDHLTTATPTYSQRTFQSARADIEHGVFRYDVDENIGDD
jgi:hypothetical protein